MVVLNINNDYHICGMCNEGMKISLIFLLWVLCFFILSVQKWSLILVKRYFLGASVHLYVTNTILVFYWFLIVSPNLECSENVPGVLEKEGNVGIIT